MIFIGCYHPMSGIWTGLYTEKGKKDYAIIRASLNSYPEHSFKIVFKGRDYDSKVLNYNREFTDIIPIPCGTCIGCRLDYAKEWAVRCLNEAKYSANNYFLTLTYDDEHLPAHSSLKKRDLQLFIKRLRKYMSDRGHQGVRFFACGEYGDKGHRPHYHILLFNCPFDDLKYLSTTSIGDKLFYSTALTKLWTYGFNSLGEVNIETCAYTARYVLKKHKGIYSKYYEDNFIEPEFIVMSRKPGIGYKYFEEKKESIYKSDEVIYRNSENLAQIVKPCAYYDKLYDSINPSRLEKVKESRKERAVIHRDNILKNTEFKNDHDYLLYAEKLKKEQCKLLRRGL